MKFLCKCNEFFFVRQPLPYLYWVIHTAINPIIILDSIHIDDHQWSTTKHHHYNYNGPSLSRFHLTKKFHFHSKKQHNKLHYACRNTLLQHTLCIHNE